MGLEVFHRKGNMIEMDGGHLREKEHWKIDTKSKWQGAGVAVLGV